MGCSRGWMDSAAAVVHPYPRGGAHAGAGHRGGASGLSSLSCRSMDPAAAVYQYHYRPREVEFSCSSTLLHKHCRAQRRLRLQHDSWCVVTQGADQRLLPLAVVTELTKFISQCNEIKAVNLASKEGGDLNIPNSRPLPSSPIPAVASRHHIAFLSTAASASPARRFDSPAAADASSGGTFQPTARLNRDLASHVRSCPSGTLACFSRALRAGAAPPDAATFNVLLHCLCLLGRLTAARNLFDAMRGLAPGLPNVISCNTLAKGYCRGGHLADTLGIMNWMQGAALRPNKRTFSILIDGACGARDPGLGVSFLVGMLRGGLFPSVPTYNCLLAGLCVEGGNVKQAVALYGRMVKMGVRGNVVSYSGFLTALCRTEMVAQAEVLLGDMLAVGCSPNVVTCTALVNGFCAIRQVHHARNVIELMVSLGIAPNVVTYTTIMSGLCKEGRAGEAVGLLDEMRQQGVKPNEFTYSTLLNGLCKEGRLDEAVDLFGQMEKENCANRMFAYNVLISGFCKVGNMELALKYFYDMGEKGFLPDIVTYNTLMDGYCKLYQIETAKGLLTDMEKQGLEPSIISYNILIAGLARLGDAEQAASLAEEMSKKGIELDHICHCIISERMKRKV